MKKWLNVLVCLSIVMSLLPPRTVAYAATPTPVESTATPAAATPSPTATPSPASEPTQMPIASIEAPATSPTPDEAAASPTLTATASPSPTPADSTILSPTNTAIISLTATVTTTTSPTETAVVTATTTVSTTPLATVSPVASPADTPTPAPTSTVTPTIEITRTAQIDPSRGGELRSDDGSVEVAFPERATSGTISARYSSRPRPAAGNPQGLVRRFALDAWSASDNTKVTQFAKPITITMHFTESLILNYVPSSLSLVYWDEGDKTWTPLSTTLDLEGRTLSATTTHFSEFGATGNGYVVFPISLDRAQVGLFTGAATFDYPLDVPPGTNGLAQLPQFHAQRVFPLSVKWQEDYTTFL